MSVGLLLITHAGIGESLLEAAAGTFGDCPLEIRTLSVARGGDRDRLIEEATDLVAQLDQGQGVLILTDVYGATPSNIASRIRSPHPWRAVAGLNLPMLIRVLNYCGLDLATLAEKALSGGRDGILGVDPTESGV
jgi:PTS system ascorbate-specific IIA component